MDRRSRLDGQTTFTGTRQVNNKADSIDPNLLDEVVALTRAAGELTLKWFNNHDLIVDRKGDGSPVTEADKAAEEFLRETLSSRFPEDTIVGEEFGETSGTTQRRWIIDPIDGTRSFVRGVPLYTTLLAMFDSKGPAIGVIDVPGLNEAVWAARGLGCFHNNHRCTVSSQTKLQKSYLCASGFEWWPNTAYEKIAQSGARLRTWGDGYGYVLVATGRTEAMVDPGLNLWDIAPMLTIIPEAGGRITTWDGTTTPTAGNWIASNNNIHEELLSHLYRSTNTTHS